MNIAYGSTSLKNALRRLIGRRVSRDDVPLNRGQPQAGKRLKRLWAAGSVGKPEQPDGFWDFIKLTF